RKAPLLRSFALPRLFAQAAPRSLCKAIEELLAQKGGEARRSEEEVLCALRGRYCKYPVSLLRSLARMYLYGEDIIIKGGSQNGAY
ncbi:MAG: hypothetical protein IJZ37_01875, partial [Clostridia bacterium]|nr:hypothetical protein [Clostridia bacterium]